MLSVIGKRKHILLARIATALIDAGAVDAVCDALKEGSLTDTSTSVRHSAIADGNLVVEARLGDMQKVWRQFPDLTPNALSLVIRSAEETLRVERKRAACTEVVWTGPRAETSYLRTTRQVVLELVEGANSELLIVGYWIVSELDPEGIVPQIVDRVADAARRGALVKVVLDYTARPGGKKNRNQLMYFWPQDLEPPQLYTWRSPGDDAHIKLHAKVLVADRSDALVTSANLTMHAMDLNMEMGIRVLGPPAVSIAGHFDCLIATGILMPYGAEE